MHSQICFAIVLPTQHETQTTKGNKMKTAYTYTEIATDFDLWREYYDTDAEMSREEFDSMSIEQKVNLQKDAFE